MLKLDEWLLFPIEKLVQDNQIEKTRVVGLNSFDLVNGSVFLDCVDEQLYCENCQGIFWYRIIIWDSLYFIEFLLDVFAIDREVLVNIQDLVQILGIDVLEDCAHIDTLMEQGLELRLLQL